jgi:hypothetical protein
MQLCYNLPARAEGCPWYLIYSSDKHGFSLHTLYRSMSRTDAPSLLVVKDDSNQVILIFDIIVSFDETHLTLAAILHGLPRSQNDLLMGYEYI